MCYRVHGSGTIWMYLTLGSPRSSSFLSLLTMIVSLESIFLSGDQLATRRQFRIARLEFDDDDTRFIDRLA